jgi:hypothetical protein
VTGGLSVVGLKPTFFFLNVLLNSVVKFLFSLLLFVIDYLTLLQQETQN